MLKLKLVSKPKVMKLKCNFSFPNIVLANLQKKEVVPSEEAQKIVADVPYDGLSEVVVDKIPDEYVIPNGTINIAENGVYDVTDKAEANVNIQPKLQEKEKTIVENGTSMIEPDENFDGLSKVTINVNTPVITLGTKIITENGVYKAEDDNLGGYSEVTVETSGVDINEYFGNPTGSANSNNYFKYIKKVPNLNLENTTSLGYAFSGWTSLEEIGELDTSNITYFYNCFYGCQNLKSDISFDIRKATNIVQMFNGCLKIKKINLINDENEKYITLNGIFQSCNLLEELNALNCQKVIIMSNAFLFCRDLTIFGGLIDIGKSYSVDARENNSDYSIDFQYSTKLTHESIMNIINGLYDIKTAGVKSQRLTLGTANINKLTAEEIAIATERGFNVS